MKYKYLLSAAFVAGCSLCATANVPLQEAVKSNARFAKLPVQWPGVRKNRQSGDEIRLVPQRRLEAPAAKVINNAVADGLGVYGYLSDSENWDFVPYWAELTPSGYTPIWSDTDYWSEGEVKLDSGWIRDGKLCGYATQLMFGQMLVGYYYKEFDLATGKSTKKVEIDYDASNILYTAAYDPDSDTVFGFGVDVEGNPCLMSAKGSAAADVKIVKQISGKDKMLLSITWNDVEKKFIGVNYNNALVSVSTEGVYETLMTSTGVTGYIQYYTGLCYDATDRVYYWSVFDDTYGYIYRLDAAAKSAEKVSTIDDCEAFCMLYCPSKSVSTTAPGRPEAGDFNFVGGATSGSVSFVMPNECSDGSTLTGTLDWTVTLDGEKYSTGTASVGERITADFTSLTTGMHSFGCFATRPDTKEEGAELVIEKYIGNDTPSAPANVRLSASEISWEAVTTGANGGYVNPAQISYTVWLDGKSLGQTSDTSMAITLDANQSITAHTARVTASFDGRTSKPADSNGFAYGKPLQLPVNIVPTQSQFDIMTTADEDGDGEGWNIVLDPLDVDSPCLDSDYSRNPLQNADDWLFLPPISFDSAEAYYKLTFEAKGRLIQMSPDEFFEVRIGTTPEPSAMQQVIVPETRATVAFRDYERYFRVPEAGTYYVAFHATSAPMMFGVRVRSIDIVRSEIVADSPVEPTEIVATPAGLGALNADLSLKLPVKNVSDQEFPASTVLTAHVQGTSEVTVSGKPGETVKVNVPTAQGLNRLRVYVSNGTAPGLPAEISVYTGIDVPLAPSTLKGYASEDNIDMILEWSESDKGEHDGYVDPAEVSYGIHTYVGMMGWMPIDAVGQGVTDYTFVGDPGEGLSYLRLGVSARNAAGESQYLSAVGCVVGTPYDVPLEESFDYAQGALIGPWTAAGSTDCQWGFADLRDISYDWENLPGGAMVGIPGKGNITSGIIFPKFNTLDYPEANVYIRAWAGGGAPQNMYVYGSTFGMEEEVLLASCGRTGGWYDFVISLPDELRERDWVQIKLVAEFANTGQLCVIDHFLVDEGASVREIESNEEGRVYGGKGVIGFHGLQGEHVTVSTIDGKRVATLTPRDSREQLSVAPGIYIVKAGTRTARLLVR